MTNIKFLMPMVVISGLAMTTQRVSRRRLVEYEVYRETITLIDLFEIKFDLRSKLRQLSGTGVCVTLFEKYLNETRDGNLYEK